MRQGDARRRRPRTRHARCASRTARDGEARSAASRGEEGFTTAQVGNAGCDRQVAWREEDGDRAWVGSGSGSDSGSKAGNEEVGVGERGSEESGSRGRCEGPGARGACEDGAGEEGAGEEDPGESSNDERGNGEEGIGESRAGEEDSATKVADKGCFNGTCVAQDRRAPRVRRGLNGGPGARRSHPGSARLRRRASRPSADDR